MVGKIGQGKFCKKLNLPDCVGFGMEAKEGNTEGDIPEKRQRRLSQRQHLHKLRPFQKTRSKEINKQRAEFLLLSCLPSGQDAFKLMSRLKSSMVPQREKPKEYFVMMIKNMYYINYQNKTIALKFLNIIYTMKDFSFAINITK